LTSAVTSTKPYKVVFSPATIPGGAPATLTVTLTNEIQGTSATKISIGSALFTAPSSLTIAATQPTEPAGVTAYVGPATTPKGISVPSGAILFTGLNIGQNTSQGLPIKVNPPSACTAAGAQAWGQQVKQSNDFSGPPGNDFSPLDPTSSLTTAVNGPCKLAFLTQPADVIVGQVITGTAYSTSGPAVSVEVLNADGTVATGSSAPVTVAIGQNPGSATLGGTKTANAASGIATFNSLTLNQPGIGYTLTASSAGLTSATSGTTSKPTFQAQSDSVHCTQNDSGGPCSASTSSGDQSMVGATSATVTATPVSGTQNAGQLVSSMDLGSIPADGGASQCEGYTAEHQVYWTFTGTSSGVRTKMVALSTNEGVPVGNLQALIDGQKFCLLAPQTFVTDLGTNAPQDLTGPDGTPWFSGLLPNCPSSGPITGPCVSGRSGVLNALDAELTITATIPAGFAGDPAGRG
jgi:hypothetical protein